MSSKKTKIMGIIVLSLLIVIMIFVMYKFVGPGAKDIKVAKSFIGKLYNIDAINTPKDLNDIHYKRVRTPNTQNELIYKTIMADSYGIDLDKNYNVIGFANKEKVDTSSKITIEEARKKSDVYLSKIYNDGFTFKNIKVEKENDKISYYSFVYLKSKNGYPFYFDEIIVNVNKETGMLQNYANSSLQKQCKEEKIIISNEEAEQEAINWFDKHNKNGKIIEKTELAYADKKEKNEEKNLSELCYVVVVQGKDENDIDITRKIFISVNNKEVINNIKYESEDSVVAS